MVLIIISDQVRLCPIVAKPFFRTSILSPRGLFKDILSHYIKYFIRAICLEIKSVPSAKMEKKYFVELPCRDSHVSPLCS